MQHGTSTEITVFGYARRLPHLSYGRQNRLTEVEKILDPDSNQGERINSA